MAPMADLRERLSRLGNLPALPGTIVRLLQSLTKGDTELEEVEGIVRADEAVSAAVLRMANSALLGVADRAFTLGESITRLGMRNLQRIAICLNAARMMGQEGGGYGLHRGEMWRSSLSGALASEVLARRTRLADSNECFVGALLRDIGMTAMERVFSDGDLEAAFTAVPAGRSQVEVERLAFGHDHAEVGAVLAEVWHLPERLVQAIRYHHEPPADRDLVDPLFDIVHCADCLCTRMGFGVGPAGLGDPVCERAFGAVGLDEEMIEEVVAETETRLDLMLAGITEGGGA